LRRQHNQQKLLLIIEIGSHADFELMKVDENEDEDQVVHSDAAEGDDVSSY